MMKIGIIGAGNVGGTLGRSWAQRGHEVIFGVRDPTSSAVKDLLTRMTSSARALGVADTARSAAIIVLATPWSATEDAIRTAGDLKDKILIDCTNPPAPDSSLAVGPTVSGAERVAQWAVGASVYKALNQAGFSIIADPVLEDRQTVTFVCGNDDARKPAVMKLVSELGFEALDAGDLSKARLLESFAALWIHMAYRQKLGTDFAFGILRRSPPRTSL